MKTNSRNITHTEHYPQEGKTNEKLPPVNLESWKKNFKISNFKKI